ncbi:unnamed protein product [Phytophthora fragariaefolia]|uniref:Unnamed protein product n=1 Tax=Phytophthora fragariaefolia TaxID=1490495 RepID=A0A9W7CU69_9STRA|nr:unnamed protein product [Phytophthora fragariaefolia]
MYLLKFADTVRTEAISTVQVFPFFPTKYEYLVQRVALPTTSEDTVRAAMAMENRLAARREDSNLPRVGGVAGDNDNEDEKVYYGFGVFMGLPLADLKAMKDDFVEQQALTGGAPRRALPASAAMDGRTHLVEEDNNGGYERQGGARMAPSHAQQQQQHARMNGYERPHGDGQQREYSAERGARYGQGPPNGAERGGQGVEDDDMGSDDGSDEFDQKSHSLNFILH